VATKQGPSADQFTVPRRSDAPPERPAPPTEQAADETGELTLEPEDTDAHRDDRRPQPQRAMHPETARRVAAGTLAGARHGRGRRGRSAARAMLGVVAALAAVAAIGAGGWWYYLESQRASRSDLAAWEPTSEPLVDNEPIAAAGGADEARTGSMADDGDAAASGDETGVDAEAVAAAGTDDDETPAEGDEAVVAAAVEAESGEASAAGDEQAGQPQAEREVAGNEAPGSSESGGEAAAAAEAASGSGDEDDAGEAAASATESRTAEEAARRAEPLVQASSGPSELTRTLQAGYSALRAGDTDAAAHAYARALELAPGNRDALLGAASVAQRRGNDERAAAYYRQVLQDHPRDDYTRAALAGLEGARQPRRSETELKGLLRERPDSPSLQFALGNVYAGESRWSEAQSAYFKAYRAEPDNPDYAYNLAVALDHLGQRDAARTYYREALSASDGEGDAGFPVAAVRRRLEQLQ
jgi:tetratricopeptide (TPR) repeat protein